VFETQSTQLPPAIFINTIGSNDVFTLRISLVNSTLLWRGWIPHCIDIGKNIVSAGGLGDNDGEGMLVFL
jgi:hypothetical protein